MPGRCDTRPAACRDTDVAFALDEIRRASDAQTRAARILERSERERAAAVLRARRAGVPITQLARFLGVSRPRVIQLANWAAGLEAAPPVERPAGWEADGAPGCDTPGEAPGCDTPGAPSPLPVPAGGCLREGCPFPPADGARFCAGHRWN